MYYLDTIWNFTPMSDSKFFGAKFKFTTFLENWIFDFLQCVIIKKCLSVYKRETHSFLKENREGQERSNDFIDIYLNEMDKEETRLHPSFTLQSLEIILLDLFVAGSDTTSLTINWTILYLLHHPQVQVKLHAELDRVVGRSRFSHLSLYKL